MKRFLLLIMAVVMMFSLVACGGADNSTPTDGGGDLQRPDGDPQLCGAVRSVRCGGKADQRTFC